MYINDLVTALGECGVKLYADDTVLYQHGHNAQEAAHKLQNSIDRFDLWSKANKLSVNTKKTKLMFLPVGRESKRRKM